MFITNWFPSTRKAFHDALLMGWFLMTAGGLWMTFTHQKTPVLSSVTTFSYGMLAPYQKDSAVNTEPVIAAFDTFGASTLLEIHSYFPGTTGERNSRMRLEQMLQDPAHMAEQYRPILQQILHHERSRGRPFIRLVLYWESWPRSPDGYDAMRMQSRRTFITQFP